MSLNTRLNETLPWVEKYRPLNFEQMISHTHIIETLQNFIKNNSLPHLLFYGPPGSGKTSLIKVCAKKLYGDQYNLMVLEINASENRGIEVVRSLINQFVSTKNVFCNNPNMFKLIILDEADAMTSDAQKILRKVIEKYTKNTRFCLTCNYIKKISLALQSRCIKFRFAPLSSNLIKERIIQISEIEKITYNDSGLDTIIDRSKGDMRKILNILQTTSMSYDIVSSDTVNKCLGYPSTKDINSIYNSLVIKSFNHSYQLLNNMIISNGYSINDIIYELYHKLLTTINTKTNNLNEIKILNMLANLEYTNLLCTSETLQISAIVGIFNLINNTI
jgi:replication factor C subunit 3/5